MTNLASNIGYIIIGLIILSALGFLGQAIINRVPENLQGFLGKLIGIVFMVFVLAFVVFIVFGLWRLRN